MATILHTKKLHLLVAAAAIVALASLALIVRTTNANASPMHPTFPLLDAEGQNVLDSGAPVSTLETCGECHDTAFITEHNAHADVLSGGLTAPSGEALILDAAGHASVLDESASAETNCFLCHTGAPNNEARLAALTGGQIEWANTATLDGTGIVEATGAGYVWNPDVFDEAGSLQEGALAIQDPSVDNCAQCHGTASTDAVTPLAFATCDPGSANTFATGEVFAPGRMAESGVNLAGKDELLRTWDVHSERLVGCTDCHYSINNPTYAGTAQTDLEHLEFDPRQPELGEYLNQPAHEFASSSNDPQARTCSTCHDEEAAHDFLPYTARHMEALACESCHTPSLAAPAVQSVDWTVVTAAGAPGTQCRGVEEGAESEMPLLTGYEPVLMSGEDGRIAPYNVTTIWYWADAEGQPIPLAAVRAAYFASDTYAPEVVAAFDANDDRALSSDELTLDSDAKIALIAGRLEVQGYSGPQIVSQSEANAIHHSVAGGDEATRDCETCHTDDSRLAAPITIARTTPGGTLPTFPEGDPAAGAGSLSIGPDGTVAFTPHTDQPARHVFGFSRVSLIDWIGAGLFVATLLAVMTHGGLRFLATRRLGKHSAARSEEYMYSIYERLWHWLQTATIGILIFTGLIIHRPEMFGMFSFAGVVLVHNVVAVILLINAALAAFYHFSTGEIQQFLPRPYGLFDQLFRQARFYVDGIFRHQPHPFEKTPQRKMNPLQQVTYLGLLNVLLPLQIITGLLMWGVERWPELAAMLGGLPLLAPVHTMVAWMFASFIVAHVYLTTTGPTPLTSIKAMIMGWEELEAHAATD